VLGWYASTIYLGCPILLFYQKIHSIVHEGERVTLSEAAVSSRTVVTFVTWLISRTEFSSSELVL